MKKHPLLYLLLIPAQLVLDLLVFWGAAALDGVLTAENVEEMNAPYTFSAMFLFGILTAFVVVAAVVLAVGGCWRLYKKKKRAAPTEEAPRKTDE